jgi:glycosyltransferase involved in cell wall biosynthesis
VKVLFDNVNVSSSSGPNSFGKKLIDGLNERGHVAGPSVQDPDVQLSFIVATQKRAKLALRLDGIYFNSAQNWLAMNEPIKKSYDLADLVIFQSHFNKRLTERYFGPARKYEVIGNGTCLKAIQEVPALENKALDGYEEVWSCASSWRPHKRLSENIRYFLEVAPNNACLVVAGENPDHRINHPRVMYAGHLNWSQCVSLYKRSKKFLHLAFLDHCPNVVVDARASGCQLVVASSGGTKEIAGPEAIVVQDMDWDLRPLELYSPPVLDFSKAEKNGIESTVDIVDVTKRYEKALLTA